MAGDFKVKVGEFEGPLDVLLTLIEKHKLHISQVALAQVADDFLNYLQDHRDMPKSEIANFLLVASTLVLIKSISLLPTLELTPAEEASVEDLERRLKHYERVRELGRDLSGLFGRRIIFEREGVGQRPIVFAPAKDATIPNLVLAVKTVLKNLPKVEKLPEIVVRKIISLEEVIEDLTKRVSNNLKMRFSEYVGERRHEKVNVIVSFLGMLELVKQGMIDVRQDNHFGEIDLETKMADVPRYV